MIEVWSEGVPDANMDESILVELGAMVQRHPWWRARARLTGALLSQLGIEPPARVLDFGCGWGITLQALERAGYRVVGADISRRALEPLDTPGRTLAVADLTRPLPGGIEPCAAVLALDVIEHLDDDRDALARLGTLLAPQGVLIVSVPALPELFSEFDTIQGHRRRYTPETLRAAFAGTGLALDRVFWWGQWMVPLVQRQRRRPRSAAGRTAADAFRPYLQLPPWPVPWALSAAYALEQNRALAGRLTTGTSLFAVARPGSC